MLNRKIDHLVYATNTFDETIIWFYEISGVKPVFGGYHKTQGTKNALVRIGERSYLEILGIDKDNFNVKGSRWMGIDLIKKPILTRWALESEDLNSDAAVLKTYNSEMGSIKAGHRKKENGEDLNWEMILPLSEPKTELAPFVIDWGSTAHPAAELEVGCELLELKFSTSSIIGMKNLYDNLNIINAEIVHGDFDSISARIMTPKGIVLM